MVMASEQPDQEDEQQDAKETKETSAGLVDGKIGGYEPPATPLAEDMITLSDVPRAKWQTLTKLELIKVTWAWEAAVGPNGPFRSGTSLSSPQKNRKLRHSSCLLR